MAHSGWFYGEQDRRLIATLSVPAPSMSLFFVGTIDEGQGDALPVDDGYWNDNTIDLGIQDTGTIIQAYFQLVENGRVLWEHTTVVTTVAGSIGELLDPVEARPYVKNVVVTAQSVQFTGDYITTANALRGGVFGAVIEVCRESQPIATGRYWTSPEPGVSPFSSFESITVALVGDVSALLNAPDDDPSWTIRFRGDPATALRDPTATHYWSGEFTLTRDQFTVAR